MRVLMLLLLIAISFDISFSQTKEQRVYLWDVSPFVDPKAPKDLAENLRNHLVQTIQGIPVDPQNEIVVIPFFHEIIDEWRFNATIDGKKNIVSKITNFKQKDKHSTNIIGAIEKFWKLAKPGYRNYMFVYTDGKQNMGAGEKGLLSTINSWNSHNADQRNYGFYVLVTEEASLGGQINSAADTQDNFWVVKDANVHISIINVVQPILYSVRDNDQIEIEFEGDLDSFDGKVQLSTADEYYNLTQTTTSLTNGKISVVISPKNGGCVPEKHDMRIMVTKVDGSCYSFVTPSFVTVKCINKPVRILKISIK